MFHDPDDHDTSDHHDAPVFGGDSEPHDSWNVGVNENTGNTVSLWSGGRTFDNGTWDEVRPK